MQKVKEYYSSTVMKKPLWIRIDVLREQFCDIDVTKDYYDRECVTFAFSGNYDEPSVCDVLDKVSDKFDEGSYG